MLMDMRKGHTYHKVMARYSWLYRTLCTERAASVGKACMQIGNFENTEVGVEGAGVPVLLCCWTRVLRTFSLWKCRMSHFA